MTPSTLRLIDYCGGYLGSQFTAGIESSRYAFHQFHAPTMQPGLMLDGASLDGFASALYGAPVTQVDAERAWSDCCLRLNTMQREEIADICLSTYPQLPVLRGRKHPHLALNMMRLLVAIAWTHGQLLLDRDQCLITLGDHVIGFRGQGVEFPRNDYRRYPARYIEDYTTALNRRTGEPMLALPRTTSVYRFLLHQLPHLQTEIDLIFSAAVHLDLETRLLSFFTLLTPGDDDLIPLDPEIDRELDAPTEVDLATYQLQQRLARL